MKGIKLILTISVFIICILLNVSTTFDKNKFVLELPDDIYGEWEVTEYVNGTYVGKVDAPEILYDRFELQRNYVSYNGVVLNNPHISYRRDNLNYYDLIKERYQAHNFNMDKDDTATIVYIVGDKNNYDKGWYIDALYTSNGELYVFSGGSDQAGKAEKIS